MASLDSTDYSYGSESGISHEICNRTKIITIYSLLLTLLRILAAIKIEISPETKREMDE